MRTTNQGLRKLLVASLLSVLLPAGVAQSATIEGEDKASIRKLMAEASTYLSTLIPLAYDDDAFRDKKNQQALQGYLTSLETIFSQKASRLGDQSDTAWISLKVLQDHLSETAELYESGYFAMSQYLLTSTPAICSTCHLQDSAHGSIKSQLDRSQFANDYSYAEYLFTIRQYDEAETYYQSHLKVSDVKESRFRYLKPLERLMTIELGIRQSVESTKAMLEKHRQSSLQIEISQVINEWLAGLGDIKAAGAKNHKELESLFGQWFSITPNSSHEFILDESRRPQAIWLRAKLFESLQGKASREESASTLYMLAVIDRILGQDEPYSFANLYLKQCVFQYAETPSANQCLEEYKNHLSFYYGGSAGEAVPEELVKEYEAMRQALDNVKR